MGVQTSISRQQNIQAASKFSNSEQRVTLGAHPNSLGTRLTGMQVYNMVILLLSMYVLVKARKEVLYA